MVSYGHMQKIYLPPAVKQDPAALTFNDPEAAPATAVFDRGRRGNPLPGCDCVQCFGYCMIDGDERERILHSHSEEMNRVREDEV